MNFLNLIEQKRDGDELSPDAIAQSISAYSNDAIPDYQMAAFLMAINFQGMTTVETRALTLAMRDSGEVLQFPKDDRPIVDKHSTGGVGDKVSLVLAPLLASLDFRVPMISGRGLGITGGTLDKLESIPGFNAQLTVEHIVSQVQEIGVAMGSQTAKIAPADKRLYALRDVTGTVPSIPLITASILSKKLAENLDALVMDVKFGSAAFMPDLTRARNLAQSIVNLAKECGVKATALLTGMDVPLGAAVGNWLEVKEAVSCLEGSGPEDLKELVIACAAQLMDKDSRRVEEELDSGRPRAKFDQLLIAQGADMDAFKKKLIKGFTAPVVKEFISSEDGFVSQCDARIIGEIARDLGAGRMVQDSDIQKEVGLDQLCKPGNTVGVGEILARVHAMSEEEAVKAVKALSEAIEITNKIPVLPVIVSEVIE